MKTIHAIALSIVVVLLSLSSVAHAGTLVCSDAISLNEADANYQWDEIPEPSRSLFLDLEGCACGTPTWTGGPPLTLGACSSVCSFTDGSNDWGCGLTAGVCDPSDSPEAAALCDYTDYYVWTHAEHDACSACIASTCGSLSLACLLDDGS